MRLKFPQNFLCLFNQITRIISYYIVTFLSSRMNRTRESRREIISNQSPKGRRKKCKRVELFTSMLELVKFPNLRRRSHPLDAISPVISAGSQIIKGYRWYSRKDSRLKTNKTAETDRRARTRAEGLIAGAPPALELFEAGVFPVSLPGVEQMI
jgi:hypothetical protein